MKKSLVPVITTPEIKFTYKLEANTWQKYSTLISYKLGKGTMYGIRIVM